MYYFQDAHFVRWQPNRKIQLITIRSTFLMWCNLGWNLPYRERPHVHTQDGAILNFWCTFMKTTKTSSRKDQYRKPYLTPKSSPGRLQWATRSRSSSLNLVLRGGDDQRADIRASLFVEKWVRAVANGKLGRLPATADLSLGNGVTSQVLFGLETGVMVERLGGGSGGLCGHGQASGRHGGGLRAREKRDGSDEGHFWARNHW